LSVLMRAMFSPSCLRNIWRSELIPGFVCDKGKVF
jgi:hypothetical protein